MQFVVFDLDHTLLNTNISYAFGKFLYRSKHLTLFKTLYLILMYSLYKVGLLSVFQLHKLYHRHLYRTLSSVKINSLTEKFLKNISPKYFNQNLWDKLQKTIEEGGYTLLLSSSPDFLVAAVGRLAGVSSAIGSLYTDKEVLSVIDGKVKASIVQEKAKELKVNLSETTAYTDSMLDLPLLKAVGNPIAVSPDFRLRLLCYLNHWTIIG